MLPLTYNIIANTVVNLAKHTLFLIKSLVFVFKEGRKCFYLTMHSTHFEFAHGAMGHRIDPSWGGPIDLFLVLASAPRLV